MDFDDLGGHAPLREQVCRRQDLVHEGTVGNHRDVRPPAQNSGGTAVPVREGAYLPAPGIADGHRAVHGQGGPEHGPQLLEGGGAQHGEAGDLGEKPHVLTAVVGGAVGPHQAGPVHRQHHVEALEGHVVDEHVVAPLEKAGVYGEDRDHPLLGHAGGHADGVALGDAHVEKPLGPGGGELLQAGARPHGGGDGADPLVLPRQLHQLMAKDIGKVRGLLGGNPRRRVKGRHPVAPLRLLLRRKVPLSLLCQHMDQHRAVQLPGPRQNRGELLHIVPIHRPQIGKTHVLKHRARVEGFFQVGLDPVVEPVQGPAAGKAVHNGVVPLLEPVVAGPQPQAAQMDRHAPYIGVNGHAVVVEDHNQGLPGGPGVVESLIGQAAGHGSVTD